MKTAAPKGGDAMTFLLEVGCEEIPAPMLPDALADLTRGLLTALGGPAGLGGEAASAPPFGGPRRLTAFIAGIREREEDRVELVTGPKIAAAFDAQGRPTGAASGFARAQGVAVESLERVKGDKGEVVAARKRVTGRTAADALRTAAPSVLSGMRFPKMMKWGDRGYIFVRPVHWIVALLDAEVVEFEFMGVRSGRKSLGHRFLAPGPHAIARASDYEKILEEKGSVIVSVQRRMETIREGCRSAAAARGWTVQEDVELLHEVTHLNERPGTIAGEFPARFLDLPEPVLVTAMRHHQKYFTVRAGNGKLAPGFVAAINQPDVGVGLIVRGNAWVLRARLADAGFFWSEDRKRTLAQRLPDLASIAFMEKLGSNTQRAGRLETLARWLGERAALEKGELEHLVTAARLCKADLTTGMVGEFPELQGVMGGIYARAEGLAEPVARAIEEHYLPSSPEGAAPASGPGCLLALADKVDLLVGCLGIGLVPKGSADPYGLRRAALGICRILRADAVPSQRIPLSDLLREAHARYAEQSLVAKDEGEVVAGARDLIEQRLRHLMESSGVSFDTARAVTAAGVEDLRGAWRRAETLSAMRMAGNRAGSADFEALATSAKRIRNILSQAREKGLVVDGAPIDARLLADAEEKDLHMALGRTAETVRQRIAAGDWEAVWKAIASLRPQVDRFFDKVLVMAEDRDVRRNRLALLGTLSELLSRSADFSEIVVAGETAEARA